MLSNGPPPGAKAPSGRNGLAEVAANGVTLLRTGIGGWDAEVLDGQIAAERALLDAAAGHGLGCWLWLGDLVNFPGGAAGARNEQLLTTIVQALRGHAALAAYKGIDEPGNPLRSPAPVPAAGMVRAYKRLKQLDPKRPVVVVQAPRGPAAALDKYRPAFDITGCDIYPVSYPPQVHSDSKNKELSVVGELTRKTRQAAGTKPFWMTLQVAWTGVLPTQQRPHVVPRFPSYPEERFMAYEAIVNGARGLVFFGGHLTDVMTPEDAASGWNWTFWRRVLRPVVSELASPDLRPALLAPNAPDRVVTSPRTNDVELVARRAAGHLYVIAVRRSGGVSEIGISGLPKQLTSGEALFEYAQSPLPPPNRPGRQAPRRVAVANGSFRDWFALHDVHVYRFQL